VLYNSGPFKPAPCGADDARDRACVPYYFRVRGAAPSPHIGIAPLRLAGSWSTSQEATTEHWWADVLADPRARIRQGRHGFYGRDGRRTDRKSHYRLADEPSPVIEVACSKCEWKAGFSRAQVVALYGEEYPLPNLLDHLAMPGCTKIKGQWDRCGVYYVNPIDGRV
jgi:hypothetical protein